MGFLTTGLIVAFVRVNTGNNYISILVLTSLLIITSLCARRLHDIGKSGWWSLLVLVPIINTLMIFYLE